VQKQIGHSSISTTKIYSDVSMEETLEAVNGLFEDDDLETDETDTDHPSDDYTPPDPDKSRD